MDEPAKASAPPLVLGRYLLGAQLGQGGMGRVHGATDTRLGGRKVAVKTLVLPDVAPVALCLYFCLTGHEPFDQLRGSPMELIRAINNGEFPRPRTYRELPDSLEAIILRAMHKEPAQRFPSVRSLGRALWPFAGAAHQELWRAAYGPDAEPLPEKGRA